MSLDLRTCSPLPDQPNLCGCAFDLPRDVLHANDQRWLSCVGLYLHDVR